MSNSRVAEIDSNRCQVFETRFGARTLVISVKNGKGHTIASVSTDSTDVAHLVSNSKKWREIHLV